MKKFSKEEIKKGLDAAYKKAGSNAYFGNGFESGVQFVLDKLNGDTEKRGNKLRCPFCKAGMRQDEDGDWIIACDCKIRKQFV